MASTVTKSGSTELEDECELMGTISRSDVDGIESIQYEHRITEMVLLL